MAVKSKTRTEVAGKSDLVKKIATRMGVSNKEAGHTLGVVLECITDHLRSGEDLRLIPFGSFEVRERKARTGRNPSTGQEIPIEARKVPAFRPGKALRDAVR